MKAIKNPLSILILSVLLSVSACAKEVPSNTVEAKPVTKEVVQEEVTREVKQVAEVVDTDIANTESIAKTSEVVMAPAPAVELSAEKKPASPKPTTKPTIVKADVLNADRVDVPAPTSVSTPARVEYVKVSDGPENAKPTGTKTIPAADELAPASEFLKLEQYKGKVVYLDFWASWCVPCRDTFPWMNEMQAKYADDLVIVAVNLDESKANADRFLAKYPVNFKVVYDQLWQAGRAYEIYGLPFSFVYNRKGELVGSHGGFAKGVDDINLDAALQNLIATGE